MNRVSVLRLGSAHVDKGIALVPEAGAGTWVTTPVYGFLIVQPDGRRILVDTGLNPVYVDDPIYGLDPAFAAILQAVMRDEDRVTERLASLGLTPADVQDVVNTHFHFDHAGNNALFPHAQFHVQRAHHDAAVDNPQFPNEFWRLPELRYHLLDGESELFPGVHLLLTPGHAPAHQSLLVELASGGRFLICADAIFSRENLELGSWSTQADPEAARASGERLATVARETDAFVVYGHDHVQANELRYAPDWYA
jgi:N-acyl homoserine lactone hydrolase